jgi:hypothetical protein
MRGGIITSLSGDFFRYRAAHGRKHRPPCQRNGVARTIDVKVTFSEGTDGSSITPDTFKLFKKGSTTKIAATVSYEASTATATLNPGRDLTSGVTYKAVVTTGTKDVGDK